MAFDLDNEELKATRRLHGQDDGLYEDEINRTANEIATNVGIDFSEAKATIMQFSMSNKTSDKNVANIEEDINVLGAFCLANIVEIISQEEFEDLKKSIKNILSEREQDKKRIQELEADNKKLKEVRIEYDYGYEIIHFCTKNDLVRIDKNKYLIEIKDGKFIDIKQLYIDSLDSIPRQIIIDELDRLKFMLRKTMNGELQEYTPEEIIIKTNTLQELL